MKHSFHPLTIEFNKELLIHGQKIHHKKGLLLKLEKDNKVAYGELAPLLGLHHSINIKKDRALIELILQGKDVDKSKLSPLGAFCLESAMAILDRNPREIYIPLNKLFLAEDSLHNLSLKLPPKSPSWDSIESPLEHVNNLEHEIHLKHCPCRKIKIKRSTKEDEIQLVLKAAKFSDKIRLDANRQFKSINSLLDYAQSLQPIHEQIEYWEEPLYNADDYHNLVLPIALDESLHYFYKKNIIPKAARAIIIKPSLYGFQKTLDLAHWARENHLYPVISSTFEGVEGMKALALLSTMVDPRGEIAMGLDTLKYIKTNKKGDHKTPFHYSDHFLKIIA